MRLPAQRLQQLLQGVKRSARMTYDLTAAAQNVQLVEAESIDDEDITIVLATWSGALGQTRVRRLHNDDLASGYAGFPALKS